jgi:multiple sugar transport system substrate-binding protein
MFSLTISLAACGTDTEGESAPKATNADTPTATSTVIPPTNLSIYTQVPITDTDFQLLFVEPMKAKYPQINLTLVRPAKGSQIQDLITAGTTPDLIISWNLGIGEFYEYDLIYDHTPLMKSNQFDIKRFEKNVTDTVSDEKGVYAIPFAVQLYAQYYNKDIFDKFGVAYPRDGMTWDDTIELARKVTRTDGEVQYRGLDTGHINRIKLAMSIADVDAKTEKASVNNDKWKAAFQLLAKIYSIPGNTPSDVSSNGFRADFYTKKVVAMLPAWNILSELADLPPNSLNWDLAQFPFFKESPNLFAAVDTHVLFVTKSSKNKEAAFKVIQTLTSDEVQLLSAKQTGRLTPLVKDEIRGALKDYPIVKGKNIQGVLKSHAAPAPHYSKFEQPTQKFNLEAFKEYFIQNKDLNTALRELEEKINSFIEANK